MKVHPLSGVLLFCFLRLQIPLYFIKMTTCFKLLVYSFDCDDNSRKFASDSERLCFQFWCLFFALGVAGVEHKNKHISVGCQIDTCTYNIMIKIHVS